MPYDDHERHTDSENRNISRLIEKIADFNEEIMELFLEGKDVETELLKKAARDATLKVLITPVFCGSSYKNKGIQLLLDSIVNYLPSPLEVDKNKNFDNSKFSALVFASSIFKVF